MQSCKANTTTNKTSHRHRGKISTVPRIRCCIVKGNDYDPFGISQLYLVSYIEWTTTSQAHVMDARKRWAFLRCAEARLYRKRVTVSYSFPTDRLASGVQVSRCYTQSSQNAADSTAVMSARLGSFSAACRLFKIEEEFRIF
jgi:hypothetical protein